MQLRCVCTDGRDYTAPFRSDQPALTDWGGGVGGGVKKRKENLIIYLSLMFSVPPKPSHLQSPVTVPSSPLSRVQKPLLGQGMEEGGGRGGRGGGRGFVTREKQSKVLDLITRFEENR